MLHELVGGLPVLKGVLAGRESVLAGWKLPRPATCRNEVDELAQFLASWQRATIERLSGRVEVSEIDPRCGDCHDRS